MIVIRGLRLIYLVFVRLLGWFVLLGRTSRVSASMMSSARMTSGSEVYSLSPPVTESVTKGSRQRSRPETSRAQYKTSENNEVINIMLPQLSAAIAAH